MFPYRKKLIVAGTIFIFILAFMVNSYGAPGREPVFSAMDLLKYLFIMSRGFHDGFLVIWHH